MISSPAHEDLTRRRRDPHQTLLELCEPLFLYICRINRSARMTSGTRYQAAQVASEIQILLSRFDRESASTRLAPQYQKVKQAITQFVNDAITTSQLPFAIEWMQAEADLPATDRDFFKMLDIELATMTADATERLMIFYTCLCLGFQGSLANNRPLLDSYIARTGARISDQMDLDETTKLCPEAYHHTIRRPITEPVARPLVGIGLIAIVLIGVALALNIALYITQTSELRNALERFNHSFPPPTVTR